MHTIHTTVGFVIRSRPNGEAGKILSIFTREFGLVHATAQGIRLEKSKLRYHTQDYSWGIYSLIRGREYWRVTNADKLIRSHEESNVSGAGFKVHSNGSGTMTARDEREFIARIAFLLHRLLHGEEAHPELFDCVFECAKFLDTADLFVSDDQPDNTGQNRSVVGIETLRTLESLVVARILNVLGYIGNIAGLDEVIRSKEIDDVLLRKLQGKRAILNQHINKALKESML